jgi:hypothetical protein
MKSLKRRAKKSIPKAIILILIFNISILSLFIADSLINMDLSNSNDERDSKKQMLWENNPDDINDVNITEYEEKYQTFVESKVPQSSYLEDSGWWLKGDPSMGTSDGDVPLFGMNDKSVDELAQMAITEGLDFIGITNLDKFKVYIPQIGDIELEADMGLCQGAVSNARSTYGNDLMIFYGVEKNIGALDYFGLGKRIKCLLPYDPENELDNMNDLLSASTVNDVISKMESYIGASYFHEKGTVSFCVNEGVLGLWSFIEYQALASSDAPGGVVSVSDSEVHDFLEFDAGASSTTPNWDYYLDNGATMLGHLGSDAYSSGSGGPGENVKTYVKVWDNSYEMVMNSFEWGRVFTAQHDVISGMDFNVIDEYDNIAYMGDKMYSYGEQTYRIDLETTRTIQNVKLITNFQDNIQVYKTFTSADFDTSESGHVKMDITLPHSETDYFVRFEGIDTNGDRFFSSAIEYTKSDIEFPEITITNPATEEYHTNTADITLEWEKSQDLQGSTIDIWDEYWEYTPEEEGNILHTVNIQGTTYSLSSYLHDGWNTIMISSEDLWENTAKDIVHIYYHADIPVVNIFNPLNQSYHNTKDITINWTSQPSTGKSISNFSVWTDTISPVTDLPDYTNNYTFTTLPEGTNNLYVQVFQDGNFENYTTRMTIYVDTSNPSVTIDDPSDGIMYDESSSPVLMNFTGYDNGASAKVNRYEIDIYKNDELFVSETLDDDAINYTLPWDDGKYKVNLTIYDEAGNSNSDVITYYIDYYQPKLLLPKVYYTDETNFIVNWTVYDTSTSIDTIFLTFNGTTQELSNNSKGYVFTETDFNEDGIYPFSLTVNDSLGHEITRDSKVVMDTTDPIIYTVWIEDNYFSTLMGSYFRVGITMKDNLSNIKNVSLFYSIYTDPNEKYTKSIEKPTEGLSKLVIEIPLNQIQNKMTKELSLNVSFYFKVQNNVGLAVTTKEFEYNIRFDRSGPEDRLTGLQIGLIVGITAGSVALIGYSGFKIKRRREFGSLAKYY